MELNENRGGSRVAKFKQADICRAVKGVKAAGISVSKIEIDTNGRIVIACVGPSDEQPMDDYKVWKRGRGASSA